MNPILPSFWSFWPVADQRDFMRAWSAKIPTVWSRGTLGDAAPRSALEIEAALRDYLYHHLNWTGNQLPADNPNTDDPISLLKWHDSHLGLNEGKGAQWSCGPMAATYVGLLAAYGIAARRVWTSHLASGLEDNAAEFWADDIAQWVLVVPHLNLHFERGGRRLSCYEWANADRLGKPVMPVAINGDGEPCFCDFPALQRWKEWSGHPCVMRGNVPHAGGERTTESWQWFQLLPPLGNAVKTMPDIKGEPAIVPVGAYDLASVLGAPAV